MSYYKEDESNELSHVNAVFERSRCLWTKTQVEDAISTMATSISYKLAGKNPIFLCVLVGGLVPIANLLTKLNFPLQVDYVHATRYHGKMIGSGLTWRVKPSIDMEGRVVVVVDDILEEGKTLAAILENCKMRGAKDIYTAVLVEKILRENRERVIKHADFSGIITEDRFIFGYGMDFELYLRNAPGIYVVDEQDDVVKS